MRDVATGPRRSAGLSPRRAAGATGRVHTVGAVVAALAVAACAEPVETDVWSQASTVESHVAMGCSTSVVIELSRQIAEEVDCLMPGQLVLLDEQPGLVFAGSAVLPYMSEQARADLIAAAAEGEIRINSAYRSVAQQYLLYRWYQAGRCGITAAAQPGQSNHESGRAIDVGNWSERRAALERHGWRQTVPGDEVHFDHLASPDIRGSDVLAFQRLWNRNHPDDPIDEDGFWGPETQLRLSRAPAEGFAVGAVCAGNPGDPGDDPLDPGPDAGDGDPADPGTLTGGCAAGGGAGGSAAALALLALLVTRRRRGLRYPGPVERGERGRRTAPDRRHRRSLARADRASPRRRNAGLAIAARGIRYIAQGDTRVGRSAGRERRAIVWFEACATQAGRADGCASWACARLRSPRDVACLSITARGGHRVTRGKAHRDDGGVVAAVAFFTGV